MTFRVVGPAILASAVVVFGHAAGAADGKAACIDAAEAAQKLRTSGHLLDARAELLKCTRDACPKVVRDDCTNWIAEVDKDTPTIAVRAKSPKDEDLDGAIVIDGKPVKNHVDGTPVSVDPGPHTVRVTPTDGGYDPGESKVIVVAGEKNRIVTLSLKPRGAAGVAPAGGGTTEPARGGSTRWVGWTFGALGVASLATFAVLQVVAQGEYSDMKSSACGVASTCGADVLDPIRAKFVASGVLLGVGSALLVTSVIWLIADHSGSAPPKTGRLQLGVAPTPGGAALGVGGSF